MGINPNILERYEKAVFSEFLNYRFRIHYVGFDWKMDKEVLGISEPFIFRRDGNMLQAASEKKRFFGGIRTSVLKTGLVRLVEIRRIGSSQIVWVSRVPSWEFALSSSRAIKDQIITLDMFTIRLNS